MSSAPPAAPPALSVAALDAALDRILAGGFDADSRATLLTLLRIVDNVLARPGDAAVRTLRLQNAAVQQKIVARPGGLDFLRACGFAHVAEPPLLGRAAEDRLVLVREEAPHLRAAHRLLHARAVRDLGMAPDQLPVLREPPPVLGGADAARGTTAAGAFNPYAGHRFDAAAHAAGVPSVRPEADYRSPTEARLEQLRQSQARLEGATARRPPARDWVALRPGQALPLPGDGGGEDDTVAAPAAASASAGGGSGDAALIAQRLRQQQQAARDRERFTTRAMREVRELERRRVYSHVTLTIQLGGGGGGGVRLVGRFLPGETVAAVKRALVEECFALEAEGSSPSPTEFDLFITPPRRVLDDSRTLEQEGLAPAAKVFCTATHEVRPALFSVQTVAFPVGQAIATGIASGGATNDVTAGNSKADKEVQQVSREEALLQRMMGGHPKPKSSGKSGISNDATKKPKWFG